MGAPQYAPGSCFESWIILRSPYISSCFYPLWFMHLLTTKFVGYLWIWAFMVNYVIFLRWRSIYYLLLILLVD